MGFLPKAIQLKIFKTNTINVYLNLKAVEIIENSFQVPKSRKANIQMNDVIPTKV